MFAIYGIDEANDIESITLGKKKISDPDKIKSFFDNLYNSYAMGNDDYQGKIYGGLSEEEQQALSIELAESSMEISILTKEDIVINYITYSPKINYIDWALNYYKLSDSIE